MIKRIQGIVVALAVAVSQLPAIVVADEDKEWVIKVPAHTSSDIYKRPDKAEYFWWDTDSKVNVELTFFDGAIETASSEKEYSKKIVAVKFINPKSEEVTVTLRARLP